ncbi:MAG: queuosine precursor transporter [Phycisphaeraceae bacterium]|nr:queuosine precursor transporter [Phycisphaeraceae bacterium]MCW5763512.1 queuosine precursor transporter [Phycisphaeraceae bacterium]
MLSPLPSQQYKYEGLSRLDEPTLHRRREGVFLICAGFFLGTLTMLNILGITRFIKLFEINHDGDPSTPAIVFAVAVGVLPYPLTFLCTDFISELFGRRRASLVVWVGFLLNLWVVAILWIGGSLPGFGELDPVTNMPPLPQWDPVKSAYIETGWTFFQVRNLAFGAVAASMIAYLIAQLVDVHVFHFWKRVTKGRHLWLRNNGSTLVSQLVDTFAVILITHFYAHALPINDAQALWPQLFLFIVTGYAFKFAAALFDTIPFYIGSRALARFLRLPPPNVIAEHAPGAEVEAGVG